MSNSGCQSWPQSGQRKASCRSACGSACAIACAISVCIVGERPCTSRAASVSDTVSTQRSSSTWRAWSASPQCSSTIRSLLSGRRNCTRTPWVGEACSNVDASVHDEVSSRSSQRNVASTVAAHCGQFATVSISAPNSRVRSCSSSASRRPSGNAASISAECSSQLLPSSNSPHVAAEGPLPRSHTCSNCAGVGVRMTLSRRAR